MNKNDIVPLKIEKFKTLNRTLGYYENIPVFVKGGMPGQTAEVKIKRKRSNICEADLINVLTPADYERIPSCASHNICNGCAYLSMPYEMQVKFKEDYILNLFKENHIEYKNYLGFFASPDIYGYRNKMEFAFGNSKKGQPVTAGLHVKDNIYDIISAESCELIDDDFQIILTNIINHCREKNYTYYYRRSHKGLLRHLILRKGVYTSQIMVNIVITSQESFDEQSFADMLLSLKLNNKITSVICTINDSVSDFIHAEDIRVLYGVDYIEEKCFDKTFIISPFSFYQTNSKGAEVLYGVCIDMLKNIPCDTLFDLYCGTGTIAQMLAISAKKVIGVEIIEEAVLSARQNAKLNDINNCSFICGDVLKVIHEIQEKPDIVVLDPPRSGIHPKALAKIADYNSEHILYISCNPTTLIKDLQYLTESGYKIDKLAAVDMFPHTPHLETVVLMSRVKEYDK